MQGGKLRGIPVLVRLSMSTIKTPDGCWLYTGSPCCKYGHCRICYGKGEVLIHRLSWLLFRGSIPDSMWVLHKCVGHPNCWNPDHLYLGTVQDNVDDCRRQGRIYDRRGERNSHARLTTEIVMEIRQSPKSVSSATFSRKYGISSAAIRAARRGSTWRIVA